MMNNENEFLGWDEGFIAEENEFTLLPAGEYSFTVTNYERKIYDGNSDKIPNGAPYAEVSVEIVGNEGKTTVKERLYLMKKFSWKLTQFFSSIGQAPVIGQPFQPNWSRVIGSIGRAKITINKYQVQGEERQNNRISEFLAAPAQPVYQQPVQPVTPNYQQPAQPQPPVQNPTQPNYQQPGTFQPGAF